MMPSTRIGLGGAVALCLAIGCGGSSSSDGGTGGKSGAGSGGTTGGSGGTTGGTGGTTGGNGGTGGTTGGSGGTTGGSGGTTGGSGGTMGGSGGRGGSSGSGGMTPGGSGGGVMITEECPDYMPCGGDVVGSWQIASICGQPLEEVPISACTDTAPTQEITFDATYTFNADGTATFSGSANAVFDLEVSDACAMEQYDTTAEAYCTLFPILAAGSAGEIPVMVDCNYADGICVCHIEEGPIPIMESATYEISGNQITLTDAEDGSVTTGDFCVEGDSLELRQMDADGTSIVGLTRD